MRSRVAGTATGRDPFFEFYHLEATLPLGWAGGLCLALTAGLGHLLELDWFHREPPFGRTGVCGMMERSSPGARTERRGDAGPVRVLLAADTHRPLVLTGSLLVAFFFGPCRFLDAQQLCSFRA